MFRTIIIAVALIMTSAVPSLADAIGTWRLYPSYTSISQIEPAGDDIFVIASGSLYSYNTRDNSVTTYDNTLTLNSKEPSTMAWARQTGRLVLAYADNTIDLLSPDGTTCYIRDIADKELAGDKTIYSIYTDGRMAYAATAFGIVKIDTREGYIADSYMLNVKVNRCYTDRSYIYAMSETAGLLRASLSDNLLNPNVWQRIADYQPLEPAPYVEDTHNHCFWASGPEGRLTPYTRNADGTYIQSGAGVAPDGPPSNASWRLYLHSGRLYATAGQYSYKGIVEHPGMVYYYDDGIWKKVAEPEETGWDYREANCMAFDPREKNHFYIGCRSGVYEYRNDSFVAAYSTHNSTLRGIDDSDFKHNALVTSMAYDKANNLWVMNGWNNPLNTLTASGKWQYFPHDNCTFKSLYGVDEQGTYFSERYRRLFWCNMHGGTAAIFRYNTDTDQLDDAKTFTDQDGNNITINILYDIAEDRSGNIWFATYNGPFYIRQDNVMGDMTNIVKHKVPRNDGTNYADYLLDNIPLTRVAIDNNNRKWFGSLTSGVYLISADNNTEIEHFTKENSPLPSNNINDIIIDSETGRVWIATDSGICSYQSDATQSADDMDNSTIGVYPNPVTPEYNGSITITGLTSGAQITITTASGAVVHEGHSAGGSYTWNIKDKQGRRVASGVYMALITYADGTKGPTAKIGVVR